jgi:hypothetical protein
VHPEFFFTSFLYVYKYLCMYVRVCASFISLFVCQRMQKSSSLTFCIYMHVWCACACAHMVCACVRETKCSVLFVPASKYPTLCKFPTLSHLLPVRMHPCIHASMHGCMHACISTCLLIRAYMYVSVCVRVCVRARERVNEALHLHLVCMYV